MLANNPRQTTIAHGENVHIVPLVWLKFLLRLRSLPDGVHSVIVVKTGDDCKWSVQSSGKTEG